MKREFLEELGLDAELNSQSANKNGSKRQLGTLNCTLEELAVLELISQKPSNGIVARQEIYPESGWETLRQVRSAGLKERKHIYIEAVKKSLNIQKKKAFCGIIKIIIEAKKNQAEQFVKELSTKEPNIFRKIYEYIKHVVKMATAGSKEARELEKVKRSFDRAYKEVYKVNNQGKETNLTAEAGSNTKFSRNKDKRITYENLISKPDMEIVNLGNTQVSDLSRKQIINKARENVKKFGKTDSLGRNVIFAKDVKSNIVVGADPIRHGFTRDFETNAKIALHIGEYLQNSIKVNEIKPCRDNAVGGYILLSYGKDSEGNHYPAYFVVETLTTGESELVEFDSLSSMNGKKIEEAIGDANQGFQSLTSSEISISDLLDIVNVEHSDILPHTVAEHYGNERRKTKLGESVKFSLSDSTGRQLTKEQAEYFKDSKARDENGSLLTLFHQTDNDFTIFDTRHDGRGTGDSETPFGIFLKPTSSDIGIKGDKQMELYADIRNPLVAKDRVELKRLLSESKDYRDISMEIEKADAEYKVMFDNAKKAFIDYITEYRRNNPDVPRREIYNAEGFNEAFNAEEKVLEEWTKTIDSLSLKAKETINTYLSSKGYDGVILENDEGSFGRKTKTYIALSPTQVKNVTNENPTDDPDIRRSLSEAKGQSPPPCPTERESTHKRRACLLQSHESIGLPCLHVGKCRSLIP